MNVAEKLKNAPLGTKLYCSLFGEVKFGGIFGGNDTYTICIIAGSDMQYFTVDGRYFSEFKDGECMLFPSKENRDWDNFHPYKQGVPYMVSDNKKNWSLRYYAGNGEFYVNGGNSPIYASTKWDYIIPFEDFNPEDYK